MRIAIQKPEAVRSPVRITDEKYELWFCKPVLLGEINKIGGYWFTSDGMRFISSRNALDYLAKIRDLVEVELGLEQKYQEKVRAKKSFAQEKQDQRQGANHKQQEGFQKKTHSTPARSTPRVTQEELHRMITALGYTRTSASAEKKPTK